MEKTKVTIEKMNRLHDGLLRIEETLSNKSDNKEEEPLDYYALYRLHIISLILVFNKCGINIGLPIPTPIVYPCEVIEVTQVLYNTMISFGFQTFRKVNWLLEGAEVGRNGIGQEEIDACIARLPDGNHEEFQKYHNIFQYFDGNCDVIDYFGFLYFPGLCELGTWLNNDRGDDGLALSLYSDCMKRMRSLFSTLYGEYEGFVVNDTFYTPLIMYYNEFALEDDVLILNFNFSRIFDAYILTALYDQVKKERDLLCS